MDVKTTLKPNNKTDESHTSVPISTLLTTY